MDISHYIAPVISAIGGIGSALIGSSSSSSMNRLSMEFSREEAEKQRAWQERMYYQQLKDSSPVEELRKMREAGVNPLSFDGSIAAPSVGSGAAASTPPLENPALVGSQLAGSIAQDVLALSQARNLDANTQRTKTLLPGELSIQGMNLNLGESQVELNRTQKDELLSRMQVAEANIRNIDEQTNNLLKSGKLLDLSVKEKEIFLKDFEKRLEAELLASKSRLRLDEATIKHISSQIALNAAQIDYVNQSTSNLYDIHLMNGVELKYKDKILKCSYDTQKNEYDLSVLRGIKESRIAAKRSLSSGSVHRYINDTLDTFEILTSIVGNVFGTMPQYLNKK